MKQWVYLIYADGSVIKKNLKLGFEDKVSLTKLDHATEGILNYGNLKTMLIRFLFIRLLQSIPSSKF